MRHRGTRQSPAVVPCGMVATPGSWYQTQLAADPVPWLSQTPQTSTNDHKQNANSDRQEKVGPVEQSADPWAVVRRA